MFIHKNYASFLLLATIVVILIFSSNSLLSANYNDVSIISSTKSKLVISYKPGFNGFDEVLTLDGTKVIIPSIKGAISTETSPGQPMEFIRRIPITVPSPSGFNLKNYEVKSKIIQTGKIVPFPELFKNDGMDDHQYIIDTSQYENYTAPEFVKMYYNGIARDRHVAYIDINAARYDNIKQEIQIPEEIIIEIEFEAGHSANTQKSSSGFKTTINHNETRNWTINETFSKKNITKTESIHSLSNGKWYKIPIEEEGIYKLTPSQLSNIGINITKEEVSTIKIFGNGGKELSESITDALDNRLNQQKIIVNTNGDGSLKEIIFYGSPAQGFEYVLKDDYSELEFHHYINHYSMYNYYLFTWGGDDGLRAEEIETPGGEPTLRPATYHEMIFYEEEFVNPFAEGSGRTWLGSNIFPLTKTDQLPNLDRNGEIKIRYSLGHRSNSSGRFYIYQNGKEIDWIRMNSLTNDYQNGYFNQNSVVIPAAEIAQDNRSVLKFEYENTNLASSVAFFDYYEIHYPRSFVPINNEISFFSDPDTSGLVEYKINGFSGNIYGFDVSDAADPELLKNEAITGGMFIFLTETRKKDPKRFYLSSRIKDAKIEKIDWANIRTNHANTEVIVITHKDLLTSAETYKEYRQKQSNMSVSVYTTDEIFNEFGSAVPDVTAIRDFISYAFHNWDVKPKYVVLWGDGTFEFTPKYSVKYSTGKNNIELISNRDVNYVPPYELFENYNGYFDERDSYSTDDFYVKVAGEDDMIDIAIGRLPVNTENGNWMVEKIDHYENNSSNDAWRTTVTMVADDSYSRDYYDKASFSHQSDDIAELYIPSDFQINKIYLVEYPTVFAAGGRTKPQVTEDLLTTVNTTGSLFLNWIGHGNPRVWSHEGIFEREETIPLMKNIDKLFFLCAATCDFGRFDMNELSSGAEMLLYSKNGGAIGVFAATRVVYKSANAQINEDFYSEIFKRTENNEYRTLGEAMFALKQYRTSINDRKFFLMGDPTLKLLIPEYVIRFDKINGMPIDNDQDTVELKALSNVTVEASIINPATGMIYDEYNGTSIITMLDADEEIVAVDIDDSRHYILKRGGTLNRSSYPVENGKFTAEFIIPRDISFADDQGRLYGYAYSEKNEYAKGFSDRFILGGINPDAIPDEDGPEISIYLDSRKFVPGDIVSDNPLLIVDLSDESGINATGNSIGHNIEAWIDDNPRSINLTSKFTNSLENSNSGTVEEYLYGLQPGTHSIKIRAWDVFNNYSTAETVFRIAGAEEGIIISDLKVIPNPFTEDGYFEFQHNISTPFTAEITVYSSLGQKICTIQEDLSSLHTSQIFWHGFDDNENSLPSGMYYYRLHLRSNGKIAEKTGTISYIR